MPAYDGQRNDRDEVLGSVDVKALLDQLGAARGLPRRDRQSPRAFVCPDATHAQSGASPPATVSTVGGIQLWHCHACGAGGSALDALLAAKEARDKGEAFRILRGESRYQPLRTRRPGDPTDRDEDSKDPTPEDAARARRALAAYFASCHDRLLRPPSAPIRQWLYDRGLTDHELNRHGIGFDPGYRRVWRPKRTLIATKGPAITLPLYGTSGTVIHGQARVLEKHASNKYLNPARTWMGPNPRIGMVWSPPAADFNVVVVCEGMFDAYITARLFATFAMTGAKQPEERIARRLANNAAGRPIVVCLDPDAEGYRGALRLIELLRACGAAAGGVLLPGCDVNDLYLQDPAAFPHILCPGVLEAAERAKRRRARRFAPFTPPPPPARPWTSMTSEAIGQLRRTNTIESEYG